MIKALFLYCSGAIALLAMLSLISCKCPPVGADGVKPPCVYIGPSVTATFSFNNVGLSLTAWGEGAKPLGPITIPDTVLGIPVGTK
jgi:hypothetical protein